MQILLIDDDVELSAMLTEYLDAEGFKTVVAHDGETGVNEALSGAYAAVILDIMLPRIGGIEVLRKIRHESRLPVLMLTAKGDDVDRVVGLEMGADDYIPKPCYPRELVARLRAVLRRSSGDMAHDDDEALVHGNLRLVSAQHRAEWNGAALDLTVSEFNVLKILMRAEDRVATKEELSLQVLGRPREPYDRSIDVHVSNLRQKLQAASGDNGLIETVRGVGYRMRRD